MTLFADGDRYEPGERMPRARVIGWIGIAVAAAVLGVFVVAPSPYVVEQPGPMYDTLGTARLSDGTEIPLISIPDETTYPTEGSLDLTTVTVVGNPERRPNWIEIGMAWLDPSKAVVPVEAVFPNNLTRQEREQRNQIAMVNSQQDAIAAALVELGYDVPRDVTVRTIFDDSPAEGVLEVGDVIASVNGRAVHDIAALREAIQANGTDAPATFEVRREGETIEVEMIPSGTGGALVIGVGAQTVYELPIDVEIRLDDVGGPSAGMMFALGIIDKLTPGALNGGARVAGTGTIDSGGNVGPIGGIVQKMHAARADDVSWFLAPRANCSEVVDATPAGLSVLAVETLDDAMTALDTIADGADTSGLPTCVSG